MKADGIPFVDLKTQYAALAGEIEAAMQPVLQQAAFILGDDVAAFEREFLQFLDARHGFGVASGTDALHLALRTLGVGPGDEVIVPANTFIATAFAVSYTGARPVLADVDPVTYCLDPNALEKAISRRTKAIVPVHLYGQCADMAAIGAVARRRNLPVLEDACQAHGAEQNGVRAGSLGDLAAFSFYPGKNLGAYGDGGFVTASTPEMADRLRMLRNYGQDVKYEHKILGFNSRLDTLQAAVLRVKLRRLREWNLARRQKASLYREMFLDSPVVAPEEARGNFHVYHLYVVRVPSRDRLVGLLAADGIATGIHYPIPIHLQPAYRDLGYKPGSFPVTEKAAGEILSLPIFPEITNQQVERVAERVRAHVRLLR